MASVFKRGGKASRGYWYVSWFDHTGNRRERSSRTTCKATAQRLAAKLEADAALRREGIIDPRAEEVTLQAQRPLAEHLADFRADLQARQNTAKHVRMTGNQIADLAAGFQAQRIGDLRPAAILQAINAKRQQGASLRTCNAYLRSIKSFTRWLWRERRTADDALAGMTGYNDQTDRRHVRREVWAAELTYLLQHVEQDQRAGFNLAGPDRAILYRVALGTGFRANELRTLTVASFALDGDPPAITVRAAYSKRRRDDAQPIRPDLAELLRPWLAGRPAAEAVFGALPGGTARMLRADLKAARAAWLAEAMDDVQEHARRLQSDFLRYRDSDGRVADFHAMRHTYISGIVAGGATVKTAQELARHCSPTLTIGRYAHARLHDLTGALDALPDLDPQAKGQPDAAPLRATGTTGHTPGNGPVGPPQISPQLSRETGLRGAKGCEQPESGGLNPPRPNLLPIAGLSDPVRGAADGSKERRRWESNPRWRICNPTATPENAEENGNSEPTPADSPAVETADPDLRAVIERWADLPDALKAGILAMVRAANGT